MNTDTPLSAMVPLANYFAERKTQFPSNTSGTWYVRQHRAELVKAGALVLHCGRWQAIPDKFDAYIPEAARRSAEQAIA